LLGDKGNCWLMMKMRVRVLWSGSWTRFFSEPAMERDE
jgi:hypothetical protein